MSMSKPTHNEEEYFAHENAEKTRALALEHAQALSEQEKAQLKSLHFMHCPKCGMKLHELTFRGVVVEKCFECHGVFLDEHDLNELSGEESYWSKMLEFFAKKDYGEGSK